jgi:hypothetical protein
MVKWQRLRGKKKKNFVNLHAPGMWLGALLVSGRVAKAKGGKKNFVGLRAPGVWLGALWACS